MILDVHRGAEQRGHLLHEFGFGVAVGGRARDRRQPRVAPTPPPNLRRPTDGPGQNRFAPQESPQFIRQFLRRGITPLRILLQALDDDALQTRRDPTVHPARQR